MNRVLALLLTLVLAQPSKSFLSEHIAAGKDLRLQADDARPHLLYFTTYNLNEKDQKDAQTVIDLWFNSLSFRRSFVFPDKVSDTLYRIDIRRIAWDQKQVVNLIFKDPYRTLAMVCPSYLPGHEHWSEFVTLSPEFGGFFLFRLDFFVAATSFDPTYREFLGFGKDLKSLEARIGLDRNAVEKLSLKHGAAFRSSGVALHNRKVNRFGHPAGHYWITEDTAKNDGKSSILNNLEKMEEIAGGEIIGSLPNRLHFYALYNGQFQLIDKAPSNVAADYREKVLPMMFKDPVKQRLSREVEISNAASCLGCHADGFRGYVDDITKLRQKLDLFDNDPDRAQKLADFYHERDNQSALSHDSKVYQQAVKECTGKDCKEAARCYFEFLYRFRDELVTPETAARELGLSVDDFRSAMAWGQLNHERVRAKCQEYDTANKTNGRYAAAAFLGDQTLKELVVGNPIPRDTWEKDALPLAELFAYVWRKEKEQSK